MALTRSQKREPEVSPEVCRPHEELELEKKKMAEEMLSMAHLHQAKGQEAENKMEMMMGQANHHHQEQLEEMQRKNEVLMKGSNQQSQHLMDVNDMASRGHLGQLRHQLCWLTTLVGEEKIQEVMNDPQKYAEASEKAQMLRESMAASSQGRQ